MFDVVVFHVIVFHVIVFHEIVFHMLVFHVIVFCVIAGFSGDKNPALVTLTLHPHWHTGSVTASRLAVAQSAVSDPGLKKTRRQFQQSPCESTSLVTNIIGTNTKDIYSKVWRIISQNR